MKGSEKIKIYSGYYPPAQKEIPCLGYQIRFFPEKNKKRLTLTGFILYNTWCVIGSGKSLKAQARAGVNNSFDQEV